MKMTSPKYASTSVAIRGALITESYQYLQSFAKANEGSKSSNSLTSIALHGSESWRAKVAAELKKRFDPLGTELGLTLLAGAEHPMSTWRPLLLWHLARKDLLLRDFLTNWLFPQYNDGTLLIRAHDLWPYLDALPSRGLLQQAWGEKTVSRVASQLLHLATDFGLLRGKIVREFTLVRLPDESFLYLLQAMIDLQPNAREVVFSTDWRMFLMDAADVERELFRLHQFRRVHYEVAGSLAQLKLPYNSASDYAREMVA